MQLELLGDLLTVFALGGVVVYLLHLVRFPAVVGLLVTGIVIGPSGLQLIRSHEEVEILAEIGVVLLLFTVGLELSLKKLLKQVWRYI